MRLALFGGTFDPPHRGHLAIARAAADAFALDTVLFAPTGLQPLKLDQHASSWSDRLHMVELACSADARFEASTLDAPREDAAPNYTVDTLAALGAAFPDAAVFNIVGADSFLDLRRWKSPERLLALAEWIVVSRPGFSLQDLSALELTETKLQRVHLLTNVHEAVSATELRMRLHRGEHPCEIPTPVLTYIRERKLYT